VRKTIGICAADSFYQQNSKIIARGENMLRDVEKTIGNLIDKQKISFISSVDESGFPNTKAMLSPRKREGIRTFYFTTNTSSMRVAQYRMNPKASLYFCDKRLVRQRCWRMQQVKK